MIRVLAVALPFLLTLAAPAPAQAQAQTPDRENARNASRCVAYLLIAADIGPPEEGGDRRMQAEWMHGYAKFEGATDTDIDTWIRELVVEARTAQQNADSEFFAKQGAVCTNLLQGYHD